jgi:hypothetical protein
MNLNSVSISEAAQSLASAPTHVLICDTCVLLDIIRLPIRASNATELSATISAVNSIEKLVRSRKVSLVCPSPVPDEWNDHAAKICLETNLHIKKIEADYSKIRVSANSKGIIMPSVSFPAQEISQYLYDLSEQILGSSIILKREDKPSLRATDRAASFTPPASKGAIKDCLIYEHMIELFDVLTLGIPLGKRILITSNKTDFCDDHARPKPPMDSELENRGVIMCTNWSWALREI